VFQHLVAVFVSDRDQMHKKSRGRPRLAKLCRVLSETPKPPRLLTDFSSAIISGHPHVLGGHLFDKLPVLLCQDRECNQPCWHKQAAGIITQFPTSRDVRDDLQPRNMYIACSSLCKQTAWEFVILVLVSMHFICGGPAV
jgi:hypothetical protein